MPPRETARARPERGDRQRGGIVDEQWQRLQVLRRAAQRLEIVAADLAHAQRLARNARLLGKDARRELVGGHFEAEKGDLGAHVLVAFDPVVLVAAKALRSVERDVGGERGLAHARTSGEDQEVRTVQPADLLVDAGKTRRDARQMAARIERAFGDADRLGRRLREALDRAQFHVAARDAIERAFGLLDLGARIDRFARVHRVIDKLPPDRDEFAQQREVENLLGEIARADQTRARSGQLRQIARPANRLHRLVGLEKRFQRHRRDGHVAVEQCHQLLEDPPVQRFEEMHRAERHGQVLGDAVVDQDRADQRRLGLDIVRQFAHFGAAGGVIRGKADDIVCWCDHAASIARMRGVMQGRRSACGTIVDKSAPLPRPLRRGIAVA